MRKTLNRSPIGPRPSPPKAQVQPLPVDEKETGDMPDRVSLRGEAVKIALNAMRATLPHLPNDQNARDWLQGQIDRICTMVPDLAHIPRERMSSPSKVK